MKLTLLCRSLIFISFHAYGIQHVLLLVYFLYLLYDIEKYVCENRVPKRE